LGAGAEGSPPLDDVLAAAERPANPYFSGPAGHG
jgi:hypothetical protein